METALIYSIYSWTNIHKNTSDNLDHIQPSKQSVNDELKSALFKTLKHQKPVLEKYF